MPRPQAGLEARLGVTFRDPALLAQALVHSSYVNEHPDGPLVANERLEFLGDAVLSLIVSDALWRAHPDEHEGALTTRRAAIVSAAGLAPIGAALDLGSHLLVGQGAERGGERRRGSVLASTFEAVIAALYLDQGLEVVERVVLSLVRPQIQMAVPPTALKAPKSRLQEHCQRVGERPPIYRVISIDGPDHARHYVVEAVVGGEALGRGEGVNRREAETAAAREALGVLESRPGPLAPGTVG